MSGETMEASGADDGADQGVNVAAPDRAKAVRHLSEDDAGAESAFGGIVGGGTSGAVMKVKN
jgi:hypothetical protein